jgi:hypothetical protein
MQLVQSSVNIFGKGGGGARDFDEILSNLYMTNTIFYYNTISLRCTFLNVPVKGLYQPKSYS